MLFKTDLIHQWANFVCHSHTFRAFKSPLFVNTVVKLQLFKFANQILFSVKTWPVSSVDGSEGFSSVGLLESQTVAPCCLS